MHSCRLMTQSKRLSCAIFEDLGFDVCRQEDRKAREAMRKELVVDERFRDYSVNDLCVTRFRVALKVEEMEGMRI